MKRKLAEPYRNFSSILSLFFLPLLLTVWAVTPAMPAAAADQPQNIIFLPLKINAPTGAEQIAASVDKALREAVTTSDAAAIDLHIIPRATVNEKLHYDGTWPPAFDNLQRLAPPATAGKESGPKYMAAGSLTVLGGRISVDVKLFDMRDKTAAAFFYQEARSLDDLEKTIKKIVADITTYADRYFLIAKIEVRGNERIDRGAILHQIKSRAGDRYDAGLLRADLKNIYKMGYFNNAEIDVEETAKGKTITFKVKEKPVIGQVLIVGADKVKEKTVRETVTVSANTIINPKKIKESIGNIRALYKEKGFYNTRVSTKLSYPRAERVDVRFVITEGDKVYIKEITFAGNKAFKSGKLKKIIETTEKGFFSWITETGILKRDILEQDADRITAFYQHHGYIEAVVGEPEIVQDGKWLYITFNIAEGDRYKVGIVDLGGELIAPRSVLLGLITTRSGEYLSRKTLRDDILRLTDYYAEQGYAFADAYPAVKKHAEGQLVDININLQKGKLVHINRIIIKGNTRTRDKVIRREMAIKEKGVFNSKAIRTSHQHLQRLGYFEEINITPEPNIDKSLMNVTVKVKEKPTGTFSLGAGYSSLDNVMLMGEISQNNFLGKGQRLALQANLSSRTNHYNLSFTEPHYNDSQLLAGFDIYNWNREYDDYTKESKGGALRFGYPIWEEWKFGFSYGYDNTNLTNVKDSAATTIKDSMDIHITSYIKLALNRDTRDRPYDPGKGSFHTVNMKYAGGPVLGGDSAFTKLEASSSWFFPLFWGTTYHLRGVVGQIFENSSGKLPVYEKFYLGGLNTIRGFENGRLSPKDPVSNERIGGDRMWYMNAEWIFPVAKEAGLKGVIFFDAGNVYGDKWDMNYIKKSVGGGFRWLSPMGPLRLEWGYIIDPVDDEKQSNWDFSIGGAF